MRSAADFLLHLLRSGATAELLFWEVRSDTQRAIRVRTQTASRLANRLGYKGPLIPEAAARLDPRGDESPTVINLQYFSGDRAGVFAEV